MALTPQIDGKQLQNINSDIVLPSRTYKINKEVNNTDIILGNPTTISGEYITLDDIAYDKAKIDVRGNTKQETTEGYNVLKPDILQEQTISGITFTPIYENNFLMGVKIKGKKTVPEPIKYVIRKWSVFDLKEGTYYISPTLKEGIINQFGTDQLQKDANVKWVDAFVKGNTINIYQQIIVTTNNDINCIIQPMISNTNEVPYEPYTGGQASPNPEFPQDIESVKAYNLFDCVNQPFNNTSGKTKLSRIPTGIRATQTETATGTFYADMVLDSKIFKKGKVYTISTIAKPNTSNRPRILLEYSNQKGLNSESIGSSYDDPITFTYNPPVEKPYLLFTLYSSASGTALANSYIDYENILLIEGNKNKSYSPYGEIAVKQTGKQLFDKTKAQKNYELDSNTGKANPSNGWFTSDYIRIKPGQTYINSGSESCYSKCLYDINKKSIQTLRVPPNKLIVIPNNKKITYLRFNDYNHRIDVYKLEEGTQATPYEPYKETIYPVKLGNTELNKIGDSQDYFHRINGKWHSHKEIEKYMFTGDENINAYVDSEEALFRININKSNINPSIGLNTIICNYYKSTIEGQRFNYSINVNNLKLIDIVDNRFSTLEQFKQFLKEQNVKGNPVYIIYQLKTPTETEITDPVLIEQLNTLEKVKLDSNTIYITSLASIPAILDIVYYSRKNIKFIAKEVDRTIGYIDNIEAIKQAILHILNTERYAYLIYDDNYGIELEQYIGKDITYIEATIEETLKEALTHDLRIKNVTVNKITQQGNESVLVNFTVDSIYGNLVLEVNINV